MRRLVLATRNSHKTREFAQILGPDFIIRDLADNPSVPVVDETGITFEENACLKAIAVSHFFEGWVVADDSGLEVPVLGGAPGVRSARYAGENASDEENVAKLLAELAIADQESKRRDARLCCALALAKKGRVHQVVRGIIEGKISITPRAGVGFGYDPVFVPYGYTETFSQLGEAVKNVVSHRARALQTLRPLLQTLEKAPA